MSKIKDAIIDGKFEKWNREAEEKAVKARVYDSETKKITHRDDIDCECRTCEWSYDESRDNFLSIWGAN